MIIFYEIFIVYLLPIVIGITIGIFCGDKLNERSLKKMSIRDYNRKLCVKGQNEPNMTIIKENDKLVSITLPLWQVNLIDSLTDCLEDESGAEVWYSYMKD